MTMIDFTAMWQGVVNAKQDHSITENTYLALMSRFDKQIEYHNGRSAISYKDFLLVMSQVNTDEAELAMLWDHLGKSLSSGLIVSASAKCI